MQTLFAESALTPTGWARDLRITVSAQGDILDCAPNASREGAERLGGTVLPGMPNLHSHAFQRAMAGLTERSTGAADSFWTWRETMYRFLERLTPEDVGAIAAQLHVEMLKAGYTAVGEFHYLHHDRDGAPYADRAAMAAAILEAARASGIGLTLLPVLYQVGGFDGRALAGGQRRFGHTTEAYLDLHADLAGRMANDPQLRLGAAFHSLRAVSAETLAEVAEELAERDLLAPRHIHIAEQVREVEECVAARGCRPVEWLLEAVDLDERWCLVHATHMTAEEVRRLARTVAVAGLCPTTEANLGDGFFALPDYQAEHGCWGIGSDSHISVDPLEELRWLEYGQRLLARARNVAAPAVSGSTGTGLWQSALTGGALALGRRVGALAPGCRADLLVLDDAAPALYGRREDELLDSLIFAGNRTAIRHVMVGGKWVVRDGRHPREDAIFAGYRAAIDRLAQ